MYICKYIVHMHVYAYMYNINEWVIYMCMCVCVCFPKFNLFSHICVYMFSVLKIWLRTTSKYTVSWQILPLALSLGCSSFYRTESSWAF